MPVQTDRLNKDPIGSTFASVPKFATISRACDITGLGRSTIYKLAGNGTLRLVKAGGRTLLDVEHCLAWMATLPLATIASSHKP
jgi:excisionase family DNA binding protein